MSERDERREGALTRFSLDRRITVFVLLLTGASIDFLIEGIAGLPATGIGRWTRVLAGTAVWPLVLGLMDQLRVQVEFRESSLD